ncbi:hypothetical protein [Streptococcus mitis]|uniref:DUF2207 domain-containing protein n=1 Tax=Streptococcus mitis TaxID=28037 RepID=A0AAX0NB20_STRMT|nr:hypothetical protein [Streptococcus mitis]MCY7170545.1 hypothetical protein [Streptococcus mitis]MQQ67917.1 hypothetical protein [Streptococcus mitis]ORO90861.1 hypothetical protein B7701_02150 [Streptococcus mitis]
MPNWNKLSYEIENTPSNSILIQNLKAFGIVKNDSDRNIYSVQTLGLESVIFNLEDYIDNQMMFQSNVRYFQRKNFSKDVRIINKNSHNTWIEEKKNLSDEIIKIKKMLSSNNINIDVDNKLLYNIPISILDSNSQISKVRKSKYICLMLLFSNFTNYENDRFKFKLVIDNNEITDDYCFEASIPDKQLEYLEELYSWIIDDGDNYIQKLSIVRSVLLKNKSFTIENSLLNSVKSIFQRIINSNVDRYFNQVALLKDDFLKIVERENDIYQSLHLKLIGWFSALALLVFDKIKDYSGSDIFYKLLMSDSQKTELLIIMLIFALVFILIIYVLEIRKNQDEYIKLKLFYTNSLMFDDGDFEEKIKSPCLDFRYILFMLWIVAILFLKLFTFNRNFICYSGVLTLAFLLLFGVIKLKKDKN